ncbi:MAG TPA: 6-carboxytetrahydropterin synthase [Gemmatimonadales bacterium]|nr:6-carboxytetrahydropterin synthase [Gemmatimonadales bacterium]
MPTAYLTRVVKFTATHRFPDTPDFAGATADHSHLYKCEITVKGRFDPTRGGVMSLKALDALLQREVAARFDGRHINEDIATFAAGTWVPTGEGLALYLWERINEAGLPRGVTLDRVRVQEGETLYSEYRGEP